jgi:hypothetical protein
MANGGNKGATRANFVLLWQVGGGQQLLSLRELLVLCWVRACGCRAAPIPRIVKTPTRPEEEEEKEEESLFRRRRRRRRRKVYSGANAVNEEDPERDRATQV